MINTLIPIIEGLPEPLDFKDEHHTWLSPLKLKSTAKSHQEFIQLVSSVVLKIGSSGCVTAGS